MTLPTTMRAWRMHDYGGEEVMHFEEAPVPAPGHGEVLVRVHAASINPVDWKIREGMLRGSFAVAFPRVPGRDCAGTVAALGAGVEGLALGDAVAGLSSPTGDGCHAEYAVIAAQALAIKPKALGFPEAASLGVSGLSAFIPLVEDAALAKGMRVLIHAGAGGVGSLAVQIAKHLDAEILATCGTSNMDYVRGLGARQAIDYTRERLDAFSGQCDVVLDTLGGDAHLRSFILLKPGGVMVCLAAAPIPDQAPRPDVRVIRSQIRPTRARLERILEWAASGVIRPQVTRILPVAEALSAYASSKGGHVRGKIVLLVRGD